MFLEAAARHCEIKISRQEMFAIPVPVPARRAESTGERAEPTELWRHLSPPPEGLPGTLPQFACALRESELCACVTIPYEEKPQVFEASVEAPEEISREEGRGRKVSCRGQAGWFGDRVMLTTTLSS